MKVYFEVNLTTARDKQMLFVSRESSMKYFALCSVAFSILSSSALSAADTPQDQAQAAAYFEAIIAGDVEKANALIDVPYSFDRKSILRTVDQVDAVHKQIAEKKGKRPVPKYKIAKTDEAPKLDAALFPKYVAFRVVVDGKEHVDFYVSVGESPKVVGVSD